MKRASSRLLLGLLGVATSAGLVLGGKAVVDSVAKGAAEVNAASGDIVAELKDVNAGNNGYGNKYENAKDTNNKTWGLSSINTTYFGTNEKGASKLKINYENQYSGSFKFDIGIDGVDAESLYTGAIYSMEGYGNVGEIKFDYQGLDGEPNVYLTSLDETDNTYKLIDFDGNGSALTANGIDYLFPTIAEPTKYCLIFYSDSGFFRINDFSVTLIEGAASLPEDAQPSKIELDIGNGKNKFFIGEDFSPEGYRVKLTYELSDGSEGPLEWIEWNDPRLTWDEIDTSTAGAKVVNVTFKDGDVTLTAEIGLAIEVVEAPDSATLDFARTDNVGYGFQEIVFDDCGIEVHCTDTQINTVSSFGRLPILRNGQVLFESSNYIYGFELNLVRWNKDIFTVNVYVGNAENEVNTLVDSVTFAEDSPFYEQISISYSGSGIKFIKIVNSGDEDQRIALLSGTVNFNGDVGAVQQFVDEYLHLDDYNTNEGKCLGADGYYVKARTALLSLTAEQIELFQTDEQFASAKARYEAWAKINGDASPYEGTFTASAASRINNDDHAEYWIVGGLSLAAIGVAAAMFFLRKKKEA